MIKTIFFRVFAGALSLSLGLISVSCAEKQRHEIKGISLGPEEKAKQLDELLLANQELEVGHFDSARELFKSFKVKNEFSPYFQQAQLGEAKALEHLGLWSEAAVIFRDMVEATRTTQPEIAGEALYQASFCYEALGDEARVLATLTDALHFREFLKPEVAMAEIPARLGASYNRMGRMSEAKKSLLEAEDGIQKLKANMSDKVKPAFLARVYLQMGRLSTNQLSYENYQTSLETLKAVQSFALRSIEQDDPAYSPRALEGLKNNYRDLYQQIQQAPFNKSLDIGAAKREQIERKSAMSSELLSSIELLRQVQAPGPVNPSGGSLGERLSPQLFAYLKNLESKLVTFLNSRGELNELTSEALRLKSLKKNITIESEPLFPNERK